MRFLARRFLAGMDVRVEGLANVPSRGPALLICRHYHNFYDAVTLLGVFGRPVRMVVALDWARDGRQRAYMEALCRVADWPVVLRDPERGNPWGGAYRPRERLPYARTALLHALDVLRRGELLAIFPEGSPVIDPVAPRPRALWPAFDSGYLSIAMQAGRAGLDVPLVPAGFTYAGSPEKPLGVTLRFGAPERIAGARQRRAVARELECKVRELSA